MSDHSLNNSDESPRAFLDAVYRNLRYDEGELLDTAATHAPESSGPEVWLEKGDWLALAQKVNAEKVFFVKNDPVIVFYSLDSVDELALLNAFRLVWCMARPQCVFIACPGELRVYSLNSFPVRTVEEWETIKPLDVVYRVAKVGEELQAYRREQVESGQLFSERDFGEPERRADKRLILDLKSVRRELLRTQPEISPRYVHALIGRSIFVRYLEDRGVLTPEYFERVAENKNLPQWNPKWRAILETAERKDVSPGRERRRYTRVLHDKDFTYALFNQLAEHFNGDMFPRDLEEENAVTQEHLNLLRRLLVGDTDPHQLPLFLWVYDFEVIPIELISSIYEEFYHQSSDRDKGTHYTPAVLVEFVLSQVLTPQRLATKPKILDFACGSAIFLVQAFRRIVRYQECLQGKPLEACDLRQILREQITGVEINEESVHVAAFSLYLALLHYQEPKDILAQIEKANGANPLPHLIHNPNHPETENHYSSLVCTNSFSLMKAERALIEKRLGEQLRFRGKAKYERLLKPDKCLPFEPNSFDIIVGNPPWGYIEGNEGTEELRAAQEHALRWCEVFNWPIGDYEMSQAFIARTSTLLKPDGQCGLLVSEGVLLKRHEKSVQFRQQWLAESVVQKIVNFTHVRDVFFSQSISPFCFIQYKPGKADSSHRVQYWSAKKTKIVDKIRSVFLSLPDLHQVRQSELSHNDALWKVYWWGNHRDAAFVRMLNTDENIGDLVRDRKWITGQGYKWGGKKTYSLNPAYRELPIEHFKRYGQIEDSQLQQAPQLVHRGGVEHVYTGRRLLVKRGITQKDGANGRIEARLEDKNYCFRNSIHGIRMDNAEDWERKILVGIVWSSVARYYCFMTTSSWGGWHHEIHLRDGLLNLPVRFPDDSGLRSRIVRIVDELRSFDPVELDLFHPGELIPQQISKKRESLEQDLDEAIFDLYELTEPERDLVLDICNVGLEFFYRNNKSEAVSRVENHPAQRGIMADLQADRREEKGLEGYLYAFLQMWNRELETVAGEFRWRIIRPVRSPMLALVFTIQQRGETLSKLSKLEKNDELEWQNLLQHLDQTLREPVSSRIYIDGMVRGATDTDVFIIKRNERRLWTRSLAREDAEATLLRAMIMQKSLSNNNQ